MILSENSPLRKHSFDDNCMLNMDQYIAVGLTSILQQMILIDEISMVGRHFMGKIDARLRQATAIV